MLLTSFLVIKFFEADVVRKHLFLFFNLNQIKGMKKNHAYRRSLVCPPLTKVLRIMKLTAMLLFVGALSVSAAGFGQDAKVTLSLKDVKFTTFFKAIESETIYRFAFSNDIIPSGNLVSINVKETPLTEVLNNVFASAKLKYRVVEESGIIVVSERTAEPATTLEQEILDAVTGKVTGDKDEPLSGVTVQVKGSSKATTTAADGTFSINVEASDKILVFSFVGMNTQEVNIEGKAAIQVKLHQVENSLNEVVVVGYGTQKKANVTGAVGVISSKGFSDRPTGSPANLLQGLSPGVTVMTQGSYPGASANIKIRESSTWQGGTDPLYVIDGFVRDAATFAILNPADIDNISILKDAASAAIYGIRGGNGVVLVTTKHGVADKTSISYNASYTTNTREITPRRMDAFDAYTFANNAYSQKKLPANDPSFYTPDELAYFKTHSYDWLKDTWQNPWNTSHNLSISGGSKAARYYISGGYIHQEGATSNSYNKYNITAKLDGQITDRLSYNLNFRGEWDNGSRPFWAYDGGDFNLSNMYNRLLMASPGRPAFINGLPTGNFDNTNTANLAEGNGGYTKPSNNSFSPTFQLKYEIPGVKGLSAKATFAYNTDNGYTKAWRNAPYIYYFKTAGTNNHIVTDQLDSNRSGGYKIIDQAQTAGVGASTQLGESYYQKSNYQLNLMLNYEHSFGKHNISALGGYEQSAYRGHFSNTYANNFANPYYQQINGASPNSTDWSINGDQYQPTGFASYLGRIDYNYASKYLLSVTFRQDGSYVFAPEKRWGAFPSISAGWNISKEDFFSKYTKYLNFLKLRVSYGITGTDNTAPWQWQQTYNFNASSGNYLGSSLSPSTSLGGTINPEITWERNRSYNIGLDFGAPQRLITGSIDYWYKKTTDILGARTASVPGTVGASLPAVNYGSAAAQGLELSLSHEKHVGDFYYRVNVNWAVSDNKYLKVDQAASVRNYQDLLGQPINGVIYGYQSEGIIRTQQDVDNILKTNGANFTIFGNKPQPGMLMYKDLRGPLGVDKPDGLIDGNDQQIISKNGIPRINYGFNFTVGWKGINLTTIFAGLSRYDVMPTNVYYRRPLPGNNNLSIWNGAWTTATASNATLPSAIMNDWQGTSNSEVNSSFWLKSGSLLRLKSLIVDYNLPAKLLQQSKIKGIRFYFSGENLFEWNKTKDWDPELGGDFRTYPILKGFTFGLNATF
jgi:TonB-linked SusC/RagA family outer membrane protein